MTEVEAFHIHKKSVRVVGEICEREGSVTRSAPHLCSAVQISHLPRLQVAQPEAHAAVGEAVLQRLQLGLRKQEQRGQAL